MVLGRLFDHIVNLKNAVKVARVNDWLKSKGTVFSDFLAFARLYSRNALLILFINLAKLFCGGIFSYNNVVSVKYGERLVSNKRASLQNCVAKTLCLLLAEIIDVG